MISTTLARFSPDISHLARSINRAERRSVTGFADLDRVKYPLQRFSRRGKPLKRFLTQERRFHPAKALKLGVNEMLSNTKDSDHRSPLNS
jgi:hypothetical protein